MSMRYYGIIGYGINLNLVKDRIVKDKLISFLKSENAYIEGRDDYRDYVDGTVYDSIGEMFWYTATNNNIVDYCESEDCSYLLFFPTYPWLLPGGVDDTPRELVNDVIIESVQSLTDMTIDEIVPLIDYIDDYYLG